MSKLLIKYLLLPSILLGVGFYFGLSNAGKLLINDKGEVSKVGHTYKVARNPIESVKRTFTNVTNKEEKCSK